MPADVENALRNITTEIMNYVRGAAELRVETRYVEVKSGEPDVAGAATSNTAALAAGDTATADRARVAELRQQGQLAAVSVISLDGDSVSIVPVRQGASQTLEIDTALLEQHQRHLDSAIEYRSRILNALLGVLQPRGRQL
jgi:hypothetical protein